MMQNKFLEELDRRIPEQDISEYEEGVFILHNQLNMQVWPDWIQREKPLLIFMESVKRNEARPYHKKKLVYELSSLRHFALECREKGYPVCYRATDKHIDDGLCEILENHGKLNITFMTPLEWDIRSRLRKLHKEYESQLEEITNTFFIADPGQWKDEIEPGYRMEYFYREMRRETGYLMNGDEPEGGQWNYDEENREPLPDDYTVPGISSIAVDDITGEVIEMVKDRYNDHYGKIENFDYAVKRKQALKLLDEFIEERLPDFGPYEDAMADDESTLFHSKLSLYLNNGLLLPAEVCEKAMDAFSDNQAPINSVEGLIRQIIGWREFIRIYYEAMMPDIRETNYFEFSKNLPALYWTGQTEMHCLEQSMEAVIEEGYTHHIQRLMVLSNFSNLTQTDPHQLYEWFWLAFVDAWDWAVLPNVLGMATFADGGVLASKPYVSSGNYINKMSNYCTSCKYDVREKTGPNACPFNYLYWNFVGTQRKAFEGSGRTGFMVSTYEKKSEKEKKAIKNSSEEFLQNLSRKPVPK